MVNEVKKVFFIINQYAGGGYASHLEKKIMDLCQKHGASCSIEFTRGKGHATELARQAAYQFQAVVAVGGDGTINEVACGLLHTETPMSIVPRGSGNGLARHLGIPLSPVKAVDSLFHSRVLRMDTFTINNRLSLNVSGIGFDAHIAHLFGRNGKRGFSGYVRTTLEQYYKFREFEATVSINGITTEKKAFIIAIANSSQYGNNARIAPKASVTDGKLHVNFLKKIPLYRLDVLYSFFTGTIDKYPLAEIREGSQLQIAVSKPVAFHVDGEPVGEDTNFNIALMPASLPVLVPYLNQAKKRI